jgi:hypothetical protein
MVNINNIRNKREILYKQDSLLDIKNEYLDNNLRKLQDIQSSIINKDRIIDQINDNITNNNNTIFFLIVVLVFSIILFVIINLYGSRRISTSFIRNIFIIIIIIIFLFYLYSFNIFHLQDGINIAKYHRNELINNTLKEWDDDVYNSIYDNVDENNNWQDENCNCPPEEEEFIPNIDPNSNKNNKVPVKGYFYFDGNDPQQLLVPTPKRNKNSNVNDIIDWVDHSEDGKKTYYDYPYNKYQNKLNESTLYVDNKTYSANF